MKKHNKFSLFLQGIFTIASLIFAILSFFHSSFLFYLEIFLALNMFVTAYNNHTVFKRQNYTIIYILVGCIISAIAIYSLVK